MSELYPAIDIGGAFDVEDIELGIKDEIIIKANTEPLNVTQNGTYQTPAGVDGFKPVAVDVRPALEELTVDSNGTYTPPEGVDGFSPVNVAVGGDWELVASKDYEITAETATTNLESMVIPWRAWTSHAMLVVVVRAITSKEAADNKFIGGDYFWSSENPLIDHKYADYGFYGVNYKYSNAYKSITKSSPGNSLYGVRPRYVNPTGDVFKIEMSSRSAIAATYHVDAYLLKWPGDQNPFYDWRLTE